MNSVNIKIYINSNSKISSYKYSRCINLLLHTKPIDQAKNFKANTKIIHHTSNKILRCNINQSNLEFLIIILKPYLNNRFLFRWLVFTKERAAKLIVYLIFNKLVRVSQSKMTTYYLQTYLKIHRLINQIIKCKAKTTYQFFLKVRKYKIRIYQLNSLVFLKILRKSRLKGTIVFKLISAVNKIASVMHQRNFVYQLGSNQFYKYLILILVITFSSSIQKMNK